MLAAHADWSLHAGKRWVAIAQRDRGRWRLQAPEPVGDVGTFLRDLAAPGAVAIAETYPAEALRHLCLKLSGSKRRQADRMALGPALRRVLEQLHASGDGMLDRIIATGFGGDTAGEDRFDCLIGLLGVINVLAGNRPDGAPDDGWIRRWEGWVLGQTALPLSATAGTPVLRS